MSESESYETQYLQRLQLALRKFPAEQTRTATKPFLKIVKFDVYDPNIESVNCVELTPDEDEIVFTQYSRQCQVIENAKHLNKLSVVLTDTMFRDSFADASEKTMEARHAWILNLEAPPDAAVSSVCQMTFDVDRGDIKIAEQPDLVRATTYLGRPVTTNEELLAMVEALYDTWMTPLDFSTVQ